MFQRNSWINLFIISIILGLNLAHEHTHEEIDEELSYVTCGSIIKLVNKKTSTRLHSHQVSYGNSGSGQQSVTGMPEAADPNSFWIVEGAYPDPDEDNCPRGTAIQAGDFIRLRHLSTKNHLHSHLHKSPLTKQQEVSCFDKEDTGDNWEVHLDQKEKFWKRGQPVTFKHVDSGKFLAATQAKYGAPIPGQHEVCSILAKNSETVWSAQDGYFFQRLDLQNNNN